MNTGSYCIIASVESDSHMWGLVYLQLWLQERGYSVKNLGCCTPVDDILMQLAECRAQLLVISTVNGHGHTQGLELIRRVREQHPFLPCVIGGQLTTSEESAEMARQALLDAGYSAAFVGADALPAFDRFLTTLRAAGRQARRLNQHPVLGGSR